MIQFPKSVEPFVDEAYDFLKRLIKHVQLDFVVLDDWNTGGFEGARLIYGADFVESCDSDCGKCVLFRNVGADNGQPPKSFVLRTALCDTTPEQLKIFTGKQKRLNCKTFDQYVQAFVAFFVDSCNSFAEFKAEIDWVKGCRLLVFQGSMNRDFLEQEEKRMKWRIIDLVIEKLRNQGRIREENLVFEYSREIGIH